MCKPDDCKSSDQFGDDAISIGSVECRLRHYGISKFGNETYQDEKTEPWHRRQKTTVALLVGVVALLIAILATFVGVVVDDVTSILSSDTLASNAGVKQEPSSFAVNEDLEESRLSTHSQELNLPKTALSTIDENVNTLSAFEPITTMIPSLKPTLEESMFPLQAATISPVSLEVEFGPSSQPHISDDSGTQNPSQIELAFTTATIISNLSSNPTANPTVGPHPITAPVPPTTFSPVVRQDDHQTGDSVLDITSKVLDLSVLESLLISLGQEANGGNVTKAMGVLQGEEPFVLLAPLNQAFDLMDLGKLSPDVAEQILEDHILLLGSASVRHHRRLQFRSGAYISLNGKKVSVRSGPGGIITHVNGISVRPAQARTAHGQVYYICKLLESQNLARNHDIAISYALQYSKGSKGSKLSKGSKSQHAPQDLGSHVRGRSHVTATSYRYSSTSRGSKGSKSSKGFQSSSRGSKSTKVSKSSKSSKGSKSSKHEKGSTKNAFTVS